MEILINIAWYILGVITGVGLTACVAARSYQKGKEDGRGGTE